MSFKLSWQVPLGCKSGHQSTSLRVSIASIIGSLFLVSIFTINVEAVSPAFFTLAACLMMVETVDWGNNKVLVMKLAP
ncbi:hypothetical protein E2C01_033573 [Portunus trituberculatus]|uniref:Uncharacterized protein n=1 Tax=Portunus trituberculatus TaxID=210409 RepID=A0A5B7F4G1_PORTR|nr:hypothetical protein [Portunus trituberculatus]